MNIIVEGVDIEKINLTTSGTCNYDCDAYGS